VRNVLEVKSFLNDLSFDNSIFLSIMPKVPKAKRHRITLKEKRAVVDRYIIFCTTAQPVDENAIILYDPDDELEDERTEKSIKMFLLTENKLWPPNEKLDMSNVFKWIKAYDRGEYFEWGSINDIDKPNCRSKEIIEHINGLLSAKHPTAAYWNRLVKSPSSPDQYGIVANTRIPAGTLLSFFEGEYFETSEPVKGANKFKIGENKYIDAAVEFESCYARYYNWSTNLSEQNVCVERLSGWLSPNRAICFIANVEIAEGKELILAHDQGKLKKSNNKRYKTAHSNFAGSAATLAAAYPEA
jgi:hypothetical protein